MHFFPSFSSGKRKCVTLNLSNKPWRKFSWGYSSVVEHSTADREVPGSNPGVPFVFVASSFWGFCVIVSFFAYCMSLLPSCTLKRRSKSIPCD